MGQVAEEKSTASLRLDRLQVARTSLKKVGRTMHLLIILLQQLLGMLPGSKQVPQAEVVTGGMLSYVEITGFIPPLDAYKIVEIDLYP